MDCWKWFSGFSRGPKQSPKTCNMKWRSQSNLYAHVVYTPTVSVMTNGLNHYQFKKLRSHYWFTLVPYCERGLVALFFSISITILVFFGKCKLVYQKNPQDNNWPPPCPGIFQTSKQSRNPLIGYRIILLSYKYQETGWPNKFFRNTFTRLKNENTFHSTYLWIQG